MIPRESVRGAILAGGDSTRFDDGEKALADLDGRPLLAHVAGALSGATDVTPLLAVSSPAEGRRLAAALDRGVEPVVDAPDRSGPLAGLFAGVDGTDREWLFVCGCDMPLVTPGVVDAVRRAGDAGADAVVPAVEGHPQPLLALYRREAVDASAGAVPETAGPMALLDALATVDGVPADAVDAPVARAAANVNTRGDLDRVRDRTD